MRVFVVAEFRFVIRVWKIDFRGFSKSLISGSLFGKTKWHAIYGNKMLKMIFEVVDFSLIIRVLNISFRCRLFQFPYQSLEKQHSEPYMVIKSRKLVFGDVDFSFVIRVSKIGFRLFLGNTENWNFSQILCKLYDNWYIKVFGVAKFSFDIKV